MNDNDSVKISISDALAELGAETIESILAKGLDLSIPRVLQVDSRLVKPGDIFLAYRGVHQDGHRHIDEVLIKGASFVIAEDRSKIPSHGSGIKVKASRRAWSLLCARAFEHPQKKLCLIGITGTNGKTSTVWYLRQLLKQCGVSSLAVGTLGAFLGDEFIPTTHTTPDPPTLYYLFHLALSTGIKTVCMEVSSHAIFQEKLAPCRFSYAGFTSFSRDHLDLHGSIEAYRYEKLRLFHELSRDDAKFYLASGLDDACYPSKKGSKQTLAIYGFQAGLKAKQLGLRADRSCETIVEEFSNQGSKIIVREMRGLTQIVHQSFVLPIVGDFALENFSLAASIVADLCSLNLEHDQRHSLETVPGRLEVIATTDSAKPLVVVDYAHTPDALEKVLLVLKAICRGRLTVVFGCGGDRDRGKRPMMGDVAARIADRIILTSDNPRSESPRLICEEICGSHKHFEIQLDRRMAIKVALATANQHDVVLIAGKGHEDYMEISGERRYFDDRVVASKYLNAAGKRALVLGAGVSGLAAAHWLKAQQYDVTISNPVDVDESIRRELEEKGLKLQVGAQNPSLLKSFDLLITSPGISSKHPLIQAAHQIGVPSKSEIDVGLESFRGTLLGITGTNGKSTTTAMAEHMARSMGIDARACGNIGIPPTQLLLTGNSGSMWAMELSSYQIETSLPIHADAVIFTSFSQDHVARHGTIENYFYAKWRLCEALDPDALLILSESAVQYAKQFGVDLAKRRYLIVDQADDLDFARTSIIAKHDRMNAAFAAVALADLFPEISRQQFIDTLKDFRPLPFRFNLVGFANSLPVINDSKSTNVDSTLTALATQDAPVLLLLGGQGKGERFDAILGFKHVISEIWCFGAEAKAIFEQLSNEISCRLYPSLSELMVDLVEDGFAKKVPVLFSPGCASFDEFKNFEQRGYYFNDCVRPYVDSTPNSSNTREPKRPLN
jgi:UDP-N-acetylmuramoyl-L-alanyl-D-glutamate--2,6-diaminopimelate ligase